MTGDSPIRTALYRIRGEADVLLYIGITDDLPVRWNSHALKQPWWSELRSLALELFDSREEAEAAEEAAIKAEHPKYNKRHAQPPSPAITRPVPGGGSKHLRRTPAVPRRQQISMSAEELIALPLRVGLVTAARAFGVGRTAAFSLARAGNFYCEVQMDGNRYVVTKAALFTALGLPVELVLSAESGASTRSAA